jgi:plasmid maintenance system antidote protein VapI
MQLAAPCLPREEHMNGELLKELVLLSAGITSSAMGAALLVTRVLVSATLAGGKDKPRTTRVAAEIEPELIVLSAHIRGCP